MLFLFPEDMLVWGWRIPFLLAFFTALLGEKRTRGGGGQGGRREGGLAGRAGRRAGRAGTPLGVNGIC